MLRTYKYLLRPTEEQAQALGFLLGQSRLIYNAALEQRISTYQGSGKRITYNAQWKHFRDIRNANPETLGHLNASSVQHTLRRLDKAFQSFFRRMKAGETAGFPRYKGCGRFKSIEYTYGDGCKLRMNESGRFSFYVQNVGEMRMCYHRSLPEGAQVKHAVVKQVNERWSVCLMLELPAPVPVPRDTETRVGVDVGLYSLLALSDGRIVENPRWLRQSLAKLRVVQRQASRREKGSQRRQRAYKQVACLHEHIANQRRDYLHKVANSLVNQYSLIGIEDLRMAFINRNPHLSLSSHDAGLSELRQLLAYKAEEAGTKVIAVNPFNTS